MVEQAEILQHYADLAPDLRLLVLAHAADVTAEEMHEPRVGFSVASIIFSSVVLPDPDGPERNWNDFGLMSKVRSRRISAPRP